MMPHSARNERGNSLEPYTVTGTMLDSAISSEAIRMVFTPLSPLHDGALIMRGERLLAASCILPLADNPALGRELGTRHRAAIGLTEEVDAVALVVSEERGTVSLALDGQIESGIKPEQLRFRLEALMFRAQPHTAQFKPRDSLEP